MTRVWPSSEPEPARRLIPTGYRVVNMSDRHSINRATLAAISLAVAIVCVGVLAMLVRDRWNRPELKTAEQARYATTGQTAQNAGARVDPTDPKLAVEPRPPGPNQPLASGSVAASICSWEVTLTSASAAMSRLGLTLRP